ncbi:hypothetical protein Mkiyose1665_10360 [Mycobacterium kiyosense]|uniref:Uncharacterized protein n=1 Tax=Mycobacterium kiyosense TaxID=2871094 RepID=A0AA37PX03_9MYCO|nr:MULTISPECIES: hypothetical protein [Mycobacterium]GLB82898.1 hypothetical protein SRL2020028_21540 [Mycobacterium kiyosense]GLB96188.1 hypothetical protein SRL2020226_29640 [Mycobacterium kiyosense]GLD40536.1 hypothetical protein Mkiyose1665_10360 [Mycobacterium kiyosense]
MAPIVGGAYLKAALTRSDPRNFHIFPRTPEGKRAAANYLHRPTPGHGGILQHHQTFVPEALQFLAI